MNASALLTSQGWLGPGHALDSRLTDYGVPTYKQKGHRGLAYDPNAPASTGNGLVKPLLVSQRGTSRRGIGKKVHEPQSGNEWWLKGFQSALQNVGKSENERSSVVNSGTSTPRDGDPRGSGYVGKHGGLYGYFVMGQMMRGTLEEWDGDGIGNERRKTSKKRKSDVLEEGTQDPLAVSPVKRVQTAKELETSIEYLRERDKEREKVHKRAQSTDVEQFAAIGQFLGATEDEKRKKKGRRKEAVEALEAEGEAQEQSKEERRARRKRRKEERGEGNLTLAQMVEAELARLSSMNNSEDEDEATERIVKTAKKVERNKKRQKEKN